MSGTARTGSPTTGPDDGWTAFALLARLTNRLVAVVFAGLLLLSVLGVLVVAFEELGIVIAGILAAASILGIASARLLARHRAGAPRTGESTSAVLLPVALALAVWASVAGTVLSGRVCTYPDGDGCDDERAHLGLSYDTDRYGWPIPWKTDMSQERYRNWDSGILLVDRDGISFSALVVSLSLWFVVGLAAQAPILGGWLLWKRLRRRSQTRLGATGPT